MTLEERIEMHEQWLLSMESNHSQMSSDLAALTKVVNGLVRREEQIDQVILALGQNQGVLFTAMASLTTNVDRLTSDLRELKDRVDQLRDTVDRYIRFQGNGRPEN